jgi:hypothetical protein
MARTITNIKLPGFLNGATITQTGDYAVIAFTGIDTADHVITVFDAAARVGAKRGIVFTGKVVDDHLLAMYLRCAATGSTHLGGRVTQLSSTEFRLDFEEFPILS